MHSRAVPLGMDFFVDEVTSAVVDDAFGKGICDMYCP